VLVEKPGMVERLSSRMSHGNRCIGFLDGSPQACCENGRSDVETLSLVGGEQRRREKGAKSLALL
jgi:hypothetical protein